MGIIEKTDNRLESSAADLERFRLRGFVESLPADEGGPPGSLARLPGPTPSPDLLADQPADAPRAAPPAGSGTACPTTTGSGSHCSRTDRGRSVS